MGLREKTKYVLGLPGGTTRVGGFDRGQRSDGFFLEFPKKTKENTQNVFFWYWLGIIFQPRAFFWNPLLKKSLYFLHKSTTVFTV